MPANDLINLLHEHRSIRRFKPEAIPDVNVRHAVAAGQAASTSSAIQGYCIIRVRNENARRQLVTLTGGQQKVADCGAFFVICGDTRRHRLSCDDHGEVYDAQCEAFVLAVIDATLFAQNLVLAFESMAYGICYIGGLRNDLDAVGELLDIPYGVYPLFGLCVGVPDEQPSPRPRLPIEAVLMEERYHDDAAMRELIAAYDEQYLRYLDERGVSPEKRLRWSQIVARQFGSAGRTSVGPYYQKQGADLS